MIGGLVSQALGTEAGFLMLGAAHVLLALMQLRRLRASAQDPG